MTDLPPTSDLFLLRPRKAAAVLAALRALESQAHRPADPLLDVTVVYVAVGRLLGRTPQDHRTRPRVVVLP